MGDGGCELLVQPPSLITKYLKTKT